MAEVASNYFEIRGAGVKYRKMGVDFFSIFFDVFVGGGTKRIFLWCQNLDQVGYTPRKASRGKVVNHSVKDHKLGRPREAAQMRAGLAFTLIGTFAGLLHSFPATHAVVIHAPVALLSAMPPKRKNVSNLGKRAEKLRRTKRVRCPRRLSDTRRACNKSSSSEASSRRLPS